jgi:8-oxo-dGTP pyrophosphatase MutT (NUDIX family)
MDDDAQLLHRARLLQAGDLEPVPARPAATVALIRDADLNLEVYLLRRVPDMAFAAGMYVFPGGSVEAKDAEGAAEGWVGPAPEEWADHLGTDAVTASGLVRAAVRETFEESGVLLATSIMKDDRTAPWATETERAALEAGRLSLAGLLARHRLALRSDLLAPLQHWVTPEPSVRRYDTWFFVAALPEGQEPQDVGTEADRRVWVTPAEALSSGIGLMRPTRAALTELARYRTVAAVLAAERRIDRVMPRFEVTGDEVVWTVG